ncbi:Two-component response regulator-like APRR7 [Hibiscus syriacus]|uniref:Two-component response regulator-like APRR7 n=1 Tax=Hibiscus syriacus TaxID=106335 RepID=A0A6A3BQ47_HIBSY|nr:two-component response regulator-like APRR7 [Hibiscus syriacus]KAE8719066.1 Two-component response regulator-like APRR7 [Hibiscus syriacus]
MNVDSNGDEELRELNHQLYDGNKITSNVVVAEEHVTLERDDLKVNKTTENVKDGHLEAIWGLQSPAVVPIPQQQPQNAMCCWERFLHVRTVTVLLVENDDCTRHVVTALLRNCSYEVIEASNGLQAWKILEDLTNHIDLVLTEVVIPGLPGIVLLNKIVNHKTRKNIPVIMMSSHDSVKVVFKCLSKGAVDFLVKPIRKNELKNLWQHVWRRYHCFSGSGSESGTQTQKSVKSKNVEKSDNSGSNDEDDNRSIYLNVGDGSDDGSGTQSSWTKQAAEVDSPRPVSHWDRVAECPDSTCVQVIHSNAEVSGTIRVPMTAARECQERDEQLDNVAIGKDLEMGMLRNVDLQLNSAAEVPIKTIGTNQFNVIEVGSSKFNEQVDKRRLDLNCESPSCILMSEDAAQNGITSKTTNLEKETAEYEASNKLSKISDSNDKTVNDSKELSSIDLGLKRLRGVKDDGNVVRDERNVLRRSDSSAFSRYNTSPNANKVPVVNIGRISSALDNNLELIGKESVCNVRSHLASECPNQCSNVGSDNIDMGSTTNNAFAKPAVLKNKSAASSRVGSSHPSSTFQHMKNDVTSATQKVALGRVVSATTKSGVAQSSDQELQMDHPPDHYDHHDHLTHSRQQQEQPSEHDDLSLKKMAAYAPHCGSSNVLGGPVEGNAANYGVNGSCSGSNHGSNGPNGSSIAVHTLGTNMESANGIDGKSGSGDASGSGNGSKADQSKSAHREAALTKFRQKRKERCFRKKVRYQSRKQLAEQRPRSIRGQFVRQTVNKNDPASEGNS